MVLFISPFMALSVSSWYGIWVNMELNLIMFIRFVVLNNSAVYDGAIKYFLINSFRSSVFIIIVNFNNFFYSKIFVLIINIIMFLKLGIFPFHFWFIDIMLGLNWVRCLLLTTWQKVIPFILLGAILEIKLMLVIVLGGGVISVVGGLGQVRLKKILGYSSINHICWILVGLGVSDGLWIMYFICYLLLNFSLIIIFRYLGIYYVIDLFKYIDSRLIYGILFNFISLGGLPPLFGFIMKWYRIYLLVYVGNFFVLLILLVRSLFYLYYYIRVIFILLVINYIRVKVFYIDSRWRGKFNVKLSISMILFTGVGLFTIMVWIFY